MRFKIWKGKEKQVPKDKSLATPKVKTQTNPQNAESANLQSNEVMKELIEDGEGKKRFMSITQMKLYDQDVYAAIMKDPTAKGGKRYIVIEPTLSERDRQNFELLRRMLMVELTIDLNEIKTKEDAERRLKRKILSLIQTYNLDVPKRTVPKIIYYAIRDFVYLGKIETVMHDHMIEEISCDGTNIPLYIYHREYESMPTNIIFPNHEELEHFVRKLAYISGKHVSVAAPIVDASLPDGSRINLTFGEEVTTRGSTFTIRKFRADPITIVDLVKFGTLSSDIAAYLWILVEKKMTMLVAGGTASGKTTSLNAIASFITPGNKIVSIEDTAELNLPHENWIPSVARQSFAGTQVGEISQFDLLRAALRQRPDIIIVGETRGREAYTLFQALATGHGGFSSIHADTVSATISRLTSAPMEIPRVLLVNTLDAIMLQLKLRVGDKNVRRVIQISEIQGMDEKSGEILLNDAFLWEPATDKHMFTGRSIIFEKIRREYGVTEDHLKYELNKRKTALEWMIRNNIRSHKEVTQTVMDFYQNPEKFYEKRRYLA